MTDTEKKPKGEKVMIVDDDKFLLDMYTVKFREEGHEVTEAPGSMEALNKLSEEGSEYDIILLDVVMPAMDGFELLADIKKKNLAPTATIIILSNLGQPSDVEKGKILGADGYIVKASATPSEVVAQVMDIFKAKKDSTK